MKVVLVGVYPPPYGGVSIHIQRLRLLLLEAGVECTIIDVSRQVKKTAGVINVTGVRRWLALMASHQDIVHVHTTDAHWKMAFFFCVLARSKKTPFVLSYHALRVGSRFGSLARRLVRWMLRSTSHCIAVNPEIKDTLVTLGAATEKVSVVPPFLPPRLVEEEVAEVPRETWEFIAGHEPVIAANAYSIVKYRDQDLYGIDMCIDMCAALKSGYPRLGVVFCLPRIGDTAAFEELKRRVSAKGVAANFLFQIKPCQFYPVLMQSQIFVRPTNTDGDAVSLREALYFKVPSVASDAAPRPAGTAVFPSRNLDEFVSRVREIWKNYRSYKTLLESLPVPDAFGDISKIYNNVINKELRRSV